MKRAVHKGHGVFEIPNGHVINSRHDVISKRFSCRPLHAVSLTYLHIHSIDKCEGKSGVKTIFGERLGFSPNPAQNG